MNSHPHKIPVGVSSCLIGQEVRYDGGHKNNAYIVKTLGQFFDLVPFCPEVATGMGIPRPAIQLRSTDLGIRCVEVKNQHIDVTERLDDCAKKQNHWLQDLCGYILKKDSPSCGMERVKVYKNDQPSRTGTGIFAGHLMQQFPLLPVEEEGRLGDPGLRENFIQRVYVMQRWKKLVSDQPSPHQLMTFHSRHKLIAMSHDQNKARSLGQLAARATKANIDQVVESYGLALMDCLKKIATRGNHVNVLQHIQGYLKKQLDADDKAELVESIERYHSGLLPLIVPVTLLRHHFRKAPDPFIEQSFYLSPYPEDLWSLNGH